MVKLKEADFIIWRRNDGYVGCTRYLPISACEFEVLLRTASWTEAKALMDVERLDERHIAIVASWAEDDRKAASG